MVINEEVFQLLKSAYDSGPMHQVAEIAGIALSIVEMLKAVRKQKEAFFAIGRGICDMVAELINRHASYSIPHNFKIKVLQENLGVIRDNIRKHVRGQTLVGRVLYGYSHVETIQRCWGCLQDCFGILGLQFSLETWDRMLVLGRQVEEPRENQRRVLSHEISSSHTASRDSMVDASSPPSIIPELTEDAGPSHQDGRDSPSNNHAVSGRGAMTLSLPEEGTSLIRANQTEPGNRVSYTRVSGDAISSSVRPVIRIRGSGNILNISLQI